MSVAPGVESAFVLIDRASGPLRGIRRELAETERQARSTGRALDDLSGPRVARQLETTERETRLLGSANRGAAGDADEHARAMGRLEQRAHGVETGTRRVRLEFSALGKTIGLLKWPTVLAGGGAVVQLLGALTAGAAGLVPEVLDVASGGAAMGSAFVGAAEGMGVAKLATSGLQQALQGNKKALADLTPEGRAFVEMLRQAQPEVTSLRREAQRGIFPGAGDLLGDLKTELPEVRTIVKQTSGDLGGLASFAGSQLTAPGQARDLVELSDQGGRALGAFGRSGFYAAQGLEQVLLAGGPFTDWLGNTIEREARLADEHLKLARETGQLGDWFDRARHSISTLGDVGDHVFHGLGGLLEAARGQSDSLWTSIDRDARRFDDWTNSLQGQTALRRWFDDARPTIDETAHLIGAIGKGIGDLVSGPQAAPLLRQLADDVPKITHGVQGLEEHLGPAVVGAFGSFVGLLGDVSGDAGALTLVARSLGLVATATDDLLRAAGPGGQALATAVGSFLLLRRLKAFDAVDALRGKWHGVEVAAAGAGAAERTAVEIPGPGAVRPAAGLGGVPVPVGRGSAAGAATRAETGARGGMTEAEVLAAGGVFGGLAARRGATRVGATGEQVLADGTRIRPSGLAVPAGVELEERAAGPAAAEDAGLLGRLGGGLAAGRGLLGRGLGAAGRFAWPLIALQAGFGALGTPGGALTRLQGAESAASFGLIPAPPTPDDLSGKAGSAAQDLIGGLPQGTSVAAQRKAFARLQAIVAGTQHEATTKGATGPLERTAGEALGADAVRQGNRALQQELARRLAILKDSTAAQTEALRKASIKDAEKLTSDFGEAFTIRAKHDGPEAAMATTVDGVLAKMRDMRPAGAKVLDQNMLDWARQQAKNNPALLDQVHKLRTGIEDDFSAVGKHVQIVDGAILTGSAAEWSDIRAKITTNTEKAREDVTSDFTAIQREAAGSLRAMGYSPSEAGKIVTAAEQYGLSSVSAGRAGGRAQGRTAAGSSSGPVGGVGGTGVPAGASGMRVPGPAVGDDTPMFFRHGGQVAGIVDGGELVLNRHTEADVDRDLRGAGRPSLAERVGGEQRKHTEPPAPGAAMHFALGGPTLQFELGGIVGPSVTSPVTHAPTTFMMLALGGAAGRPRPGSHPPGALGHATSGRVPKSTGWHGQVMRRRPVLQFEHRPVLPAAPAHHDGAYATPEGHATAGPLVQVNIAPGAVVLNAVILDARAKRMIDQRWHKTMQALAHDIREELVEGREEPEVQVLA